MKIKLTAILILFCCIFTSIQAQYRVKSFDTYSENGKYFLKSFDYDNSNSLNRAFIYRTSDSLLMYHIDKTFYFPYCNDLFFLSDDGKIIAKIDDDLSNDDKLIFYKNGLLFKSYDLSFFGIKFDLNEFYKCNNYLQSGLNNFLFKNYSYVECDTQRIKNKIIDLKYKYKYLVNRKIDLFKPFTPELDSLAHTYSSFTFQDTLYLITKNKELFAFDINSGNCLYNKPLLEAYSAIRQKANFVKNTVIHQKFSISEPTISDSLSITDYIGKAFDLVPVKYDDKIRKKYYLVRFRIEIDSNGRAVQLDFAYPEVSFHDKLKDSLLKQKFVHNVDFTNFDALRYSYSQDFCSKSDSIAFADFLKDSIEYVEFEKKIPTLDTLWGSYIPKNIEEMMLELDKALNIKELAIIDFLKNESDMSYYHMGLGMWIRNNFGLWAGSRLAVYIKNVFGVNHPDDMSGIILNCYFRHRHKLPLDLDSFKENK